MAGKNKNKLKNMEYILRLNPVSSLSILLHGGKVEYRSSYLVNAFDLSWKCYCNWYL